MKKQYMRIVGVLLAALLLTAPIAGCSGKSGGSTPPVSGGASQTGAGAGESTAALSGDPTGVGGTGAAGQTPGGNTDKTGGTKKPGGGSVTTKGSGNSSGGAFKKPSYDLGGKTITIWGSGAPKKNTIEYASWQEVEKEYKCKLNFMKVSYSVAVTKMTAASIAGKPECDVWQAQWYDTFPSFIAKGMVEQLDTYYPFRDDPNWKNDDNRKLNAWGGKLYALNYGVEPPAWGLWYNKALLRSVGADDPARLVASNEWTWDNFLKICQKVTKSTTGGSTPDQWGFYDEYLFTTMILSNGGEIINVSDSHNPKFAMNSEATKKGVNFALDLLNKYKVVPHIGSVGDPKLLEMFHQGKVAFTTYSPGYGPLAVSKGIKASDLGYTYPPKGPDAKDYIIHAPTYSPVYIVPPQLDETWKKQVVCVLQDYLCVWDKSEDFAVTKSDLLDIGFATGEYKGIYENNKDFMLNGGKKNKPAYVNSFFLYDLLNTELLYPLAENKTSIESGLQSLTPKAQAKINELVRKTKE